MDEYLPKMSNAIKYNFDNVLVADTKLLVQVGKVRGGPQILVLNNKLNKCEHRKQPIRCDTCCLQVEEPQFKRRSDIFKNTTDCFGKFRLSIGSSGLRAGNVELTMNKFSNIYSKM